MTTTVLRTDPLVERPDRRTPNAGSRGSPDNQPTWPSPGASGFVADTWVFFPHGDWALADGWGLGFGPTGTGTPRWSLYHCVAQDLFDSRSECPHLSPSNDDLLRWSTNLVGTGTATLLLQSVGSCPDFYRRYFAERPDLRGRVVR